MPESPEVAVPAKRRGCFSLVGSLIAWTPVVMWSVGQVARDRWIATALCFYVPSVLIVLWCVLLAIVARLRGASPRGLRWLLVGAIPLGVTLLVENQWRRPVTKPPQNHNPLVAMHWNTGAGWGYWGSVLKQSVAADADLCILTEPVYRLAPADFPGYQMQKFREFAVMAKGELRAPRELCADRVLNVAVVEWLSRQGPVKLLVGDLSSKLNNNRYETLGRLADYIRQEEPDLVLGDFNAPRRSWRLAYLPAGYRHAYEVAGAGWSGTWPRPLWLYSLDHILVGERIQPHRYDVISAPPSDHRQQWLCFDLAQKPED